MKYLLDTGVWLRGYFEPDTIPRAERAILARPDEMFALAAISLWEVGKKHQQGRLELGDELSAWFSSALGMIEVLELTTEVVTRAMSLPSFPDRDPADELIVATACVHDLTLLTTDTKLRGYRHAHIRYFAPRARP